MTSAVEELTNVAELCARIRFSPDDERDVVSGTLEPVATFLRAGRTLLFDFHRPARAPSFGELELARARVVAAFLCAGSQRRGQRVRVECAQVRGALSTRELEVAEAVAQGLSNKEVAARLGISVRTVENHLRSIFAKLQITTRTRLAAELYAGTL